MRTGLRFFLPILLLVLPFAVIACGGDDDDATPTASSEETSTPEAGETPDDPETPAGGETPSAPETTEPTGEFPVTVTDLLGREVEIAEAPQRIVGLSPTAVEHVYAVGGTVVGRVASAVYPPEVESAEEVGDAYQPNLEAILALEPDLVVADSIIQANPQLRSAVEGLGVPVVFAGANSYQDVIDGLTVVGEALGRQDAAEARIAEIEASLAEAQEMVGDTEVSALVVIGDRDRVIYAANDSSYPGDLMSLLGITNPLGGEPDSGPFPGYTTAPPDLLIQSDPDYLFTLSPAPPPAPPLSQAIRLLPGINDMTAVQEGRIGELDVQLMVQASGPRVDEALMALAEAVTAE